MSDADILAYNPWDGDDTDVTTFSDRMVVTRKDATCAICFEAIPVKSRVRAQTQRNNEDHTVKTFRFCPACCAAMATAYDGSDMGRQIEYRTAIGMYGVDRAKEIFHNNEGY